MWSGFSHQEREPRRGRSKRKMGSIPLKEVPGLPRGYVIAEEKF